HAGTPAGEVLRIVRVVVAVVTLVEQAQAAPVVGVPAQRVLAHRVENLLLAVAEAVDVAVVVPELLADGDEAAREAVVVLQAQRLDAVVPEQAVAVSEGLAAERQRAARVV